MLYATHARVHLDHIVANLRAVKARVGDRAVLLAIKANAYGHGAVPVAQAVEAANRRPIVLDEGRDPVDVGVGKAHVEKIARGGVVVVLGGVDTRGDQPGPAAAHRRPS